MEQQYLTTRQLSDKIHMAQGTIRTKVYNGDFKKGVHYVKAGPRKLLFIWSGIENWLHDGGASKISTCEEKILTNI